MRDGQKLVIMVIVLVGLVAGAGVARAGRAGQEPVTAAHPAQSTEPTSTPTPASDAVVARALAQHKRAVAAWLEWNRARSALSLRMVRFRDHSGAKPDRAATAARWVGAAADWRADRDDYRARTGRLVDRMRHPGGTSSGTRWAPLALWVGWPKYVIGELTDIIYRESSGRERAYNPSGASGLLQILRSNVSQPWRLFDATYNLTQGLRLYRLCGWSPWAL